MGKTVGIGIIGTGFARRVQIPAFRNCENAHIVSVASGSLENADATAKEFGIEHFTTDWRETVSRADVDLVCITTPPNMHHEMALFAIKHDKHVLCEKPMAMNVSQAEEMTAAANKARVLALIDHELRFQPGRLAAKEKLRSGAIGKVRHVKTVFQAPHRGDPDLKWNWWSDSSAGGGALGAINSHIIDSLNWFLGSPISSVTCQLHTNVKQRRDENDVLRDVTTDDEANMLLRFDDGELTDDATGLVSVSMTEGPRYAHRMEFYGTDGVVRVGHDGSSCIATRGDQDWTLIEADLGPPIPGVLDTGFARAFWFFAPVIIEAIRNGRSTIENAATFDDGLEVQKVLDAARDSDKNGVTIKLN
ncbi:MAG: gfo/Idh/MocA family oxidoreductase [Acidobacteria bacterium]|nr:MAG: gfo/Idh/MocA family oxidoreductase [Acidobacteriota bacterium]